ncbi:MAG: hypothetical protein M1837_002620 [Sclerophora amabilis]|nr:MAG: hypothetical protein M1837_002620 [Sclerophora amabilis]
MDDLSGLDWSANPNKPTNLAPPKSGTFYPSIRSTPSPSASGQSTPLTSHNSGTGQSSYGPQQRIIKSSTPVNDSFSNLVSFGTKASQGLSLQERQKQLQEEKSRQEDERRKQYDAQFAAQDSRFWDTLGANKSGRNGGLDGATKPSNNSSNIAQNHSQPISHDPEEDDLLSAFSAAAPVDSASHFPPSDLHSGVKRDAEYSSQPGGGPSSKLSNGLSVYPPGGNTMIDDDDDPFGLGQTTTKTPVQRIEQPTAGDDDDNVLGLLAKPVSDLYTAQKLAHDLDSHDESIGVKDDPRDRAVADLVDMGFPADKAQEALAETDTGRDVQAAVSWLLNEAHRKAKAKSTGPVSAEGRSRREDVGGQRQPSKSDRNRHDDLERDESVPAWMRQSSRSNSAQRRNDTKSPSEGEKDIGQFASEMGNNLFKSANTLWNTGRKKVQKAVTELQYDSDPSQPKWMREAQLEQGTKRQQAQPPTQTGRDDGSKDSKLRDERLRHERQHNSTFTEEAQMLDAVDSRPGRKQTALRDPQTRLPPSSPSSSRDQSPRFSERPAEPSGRMQAANRTDMRPIPQVGPRVRLSKQMVEEQSSQAYISPTRRKKQAPKPLSTPSEPIFDDQAARHAPRIAPLTSTDHLGQPPHNPSATSSKSSTPLPARPKAPPRQIPPVSPSALSSSTSHRQSGTEAFKRGDYSAAHSSYSQALSPLPSNHPICIVIFCNRALVNIKIGDPKAAISDADSALSSIGPARGEAEKISLGIAEGGEKEMREYFGKALTRKAQALEEMEKFGEAGKVWADAVEFGVGGSISIQGRNRCEKAVGGGESAPSRTQSPAARPAPTKKPKPPKKTSALDDLSHRPAPASGEAVTRMRAAKAAAKATEDERVALLDKVDARIAAWRDGKQDNVRALISSLDTVLWEGSGWKKVGMHELVLPNKVKIAYMKGVAKVHPDKLPLTATTEQRMISASVFSILNEAWDKFKQENGM